MNNRTVDPRLRLAAELVREGARFADVGTDHAYLPLYLLSTGRIRTAVASDVAEGPLACARENVCAAGYEGQVTLRLADGLAGMDGLGLTDIAVCGMGGELIAAILGAAPFVRDPAIRLILQPMSREYALRAYLAEQGFAVLSERYAAHAGRAYVCLAATFTGEPYTLSGAEATLGDPTLRDPRDTAAFSAFLDIKEREATARIRGRRDGGLDTAEDEELLLAIKREREAIL